MECPLYVLCTLQLLRQTPSIGVYVGAPLLEQSPCGGDRGAMVLDQIGSKTVAECGTPRSNARLR